jgi:hypothetical protein
MNERRKDYLALGLLLIVLLGFFAPILFTSKIIRAPDILNEYYWTVKDIPASRLLDLFKIDLSSAVWNPFQNSGYTTEGGGASFQFLIYHRLIYWLIPAPESVAWFIVLHFFFAASGVFCFCRLIGASRTASFFAGLIFAVAPENASLINAGHVLKIATISYAPWAFYCFEKGFRSRRLFWFLTTGFVLAFQFFNYHWQIAFYTCLAVGVYGLARLVGVYLQDRQAAGEAKAELPRLFGLNLVVLLFFLSTVAISLAPLASWSKDTNRGVSSGANQGQGGLDRDEAMSWSLPPEELASFVVPGLFGFSRQEGGENPSNILSYYWGRMNFTQTTDYLGLLPWLLVPLPLIFRRDRYTWLASAALVGGLVFSMGKYSLVYNLLFDYFPGINRFRVPKMIMFIPVMGIGVLAARGLDLLLDEEIRRTRAFARYMWGVLALPLLLAAAMGAEQAGKHLLLRSFGDLIAQPTRYEQGPELAMQRWNNLVLETGLAAGVAAMYAAALGAYWRKWLPAALIPAVLCALYLADVGRVDRKYMFLVDVPQKAKTAKTPVMEFLAPRVTNQYRVLPMDGSDPNALAGNQIPVVFTSFPVQQVRWQNFLDALSLGSAMPDIINLKYLVLPADQYAKEKAQLGDKYQPVFQSPDGLMVLENRGVLPKGWLVPAAVQVDNPLQRIAALQSGDFNPAALALVESPPPLAMADPAKAQPLPRQDVSVVSYEGDRIVLSAKAPQNALLVLGEKYYKGWKATVDGKHAEIYPVDHILRGVYLTPGEHKVEFVFDPTPYKIGKYLTLASFAFFLVMLGREVWLRGKGLGARD